MLDGFVLLFVSPRRRSLAALFIKLFWFETEQKCLFGCVFFWNGTRFYSRYAVYD